MATAAMKAVFQQVWGAVGGEPKVINCVRDAGGLDVDMFRADGRPEAGFTTWATIGMYAGETGKVTAEGTPLRVELISLCDSQVADYGNMLASCAFNVLSGDYGIAPYAIFPDVIGQYRPNSSTRHMLFVPVFSWDGPENLAVDGVLVTWLQAVPVTQGEFAFARRSGGEALADLLEERDVDVADLDRESVA